MDPQAIQIMETALALQRAPGERFRLRERPLPEGLVHVLEIASGAPTAVANAAAALGASEQAVLEASRFYLEQVLFASPDADAYRILGVAPDVGTDEIRSHHRWLQRWLHPDRAQAGDASVFATRVNQAWAQLRTPESRHEYDVRLAEATLAEGDAPLSGETIRHWQFEEPAASHGRHSRWLLGTALAACVVLAILIVRHEGSVQPWEPTEAAEVAVASGDGTEPDGRAQALVEALAKAPPAPPPETAKPPSRTAVDAARRVRPAVPPPPPPTPARVAAATPRASASMPTPAPPPVREPARRPAPRSTPPPAPAKVQVAEAAPASDAAAPAPVAPAAVAPAVVAAPTAQVATAPATPEAELLIERMHKAERRVAQLAAYLAAQPDAAPLWNDVQTQSAAERLRERIAGGRGARLELLAPNWQLQPETASFSADYRCGSCRVQQGRLDVKLVWRAGLWLVRGVDMAPSA